MPTTTTTPNIQAPDIAGLTMQKYQSDLDAYNAEQASSDGIFGSLLSLGGMALGGPLGGSIGSLLSGTTKSASPINYLGNGLTSKSGFY